MWLVQRIGDGGWGKSDARMLGNWDVWVPRKYGWWLRELMEELGQRGIARIYQCARPPISPVLTVPNIAKTYHLSWYIHAGMAETCHVLSCCTRAGIVESYHLSSWDTRAEMTDNATCVQSCEAVIEMRCGLGKLQALSLTRMIPCIEQLTSKISFIRGINPQNCADTILKSS